MLGSLSRREWLRQAGSGFGTMALAGLVQEAGLLAAETDIHTNADHIAHNLAVRPAHVQPQARAVIQLFQNGGPSQMDLFDPKSELTKHGGKPHPEEINTFSQRSKNVLLKSPFRFYPRGNSGIEYGETLPQIGSMADDICLVRSMFTENNNHPFAISMMQTGKTFTGHPAIGSWICYALGTENHNLPGYIVLRDPAGYNTSGKVVWSSGWLPALFQGTEFSTKGDPIHHLQPPRDVPRQVRKRSLQLLAELNDAHVRNHPRETELEARIENFELAARMQLAATNVLDISRESKTTQERYGLNDPVTAGYGLRCLMARRLVEHGVRFVQVFPPLQPSVQPWDAHSKLEPKTRIISAKVDQPTAALIEDLKQRGLYDDVIVLWTGEFGRMPITERNIGRDHNPGAFSLFLAGGGFKAGYAHGATDDFGYKSVTNRVSVSDLHATILHQLGIDHRRLDFLHNGRPERLTDPDVTNAEVVNDLLA